MLWVGLRVRWATVSDDDLRWGTGRAVLASLGTLIFVFYTAVFQYHVSGQWLFIAPFVIVLTARLAVAGMMSRIIQRRALTPH